MLGNLTMVAYLGKNRTLISPEIGGGGGGDYCFLPQKETNHGVVFKS